MTVRWYIRIGFSFFMNLEEIESLFHLFLFNISFLKGLVSLMKLIEVNSIYPHTSCIYFRLATSILQAACNKTRHHNTLFLVYQKEQRTLISNFSTFWSDQLFLLSRKRKHLIFILHFPIFFNAIFRSSFAIHISLAIFYWWCPHILKAFIGKAALLIFWLVFQVVPEINYKLTCLVFYY
jgi:hypothetical protein